MDPDTLCICNPCNKCYQLLWDSHNSMTVFAVYPSVDAECYNQTSLQTFNLGLGQWTPSSPDCPREGEFLCFPKIEEWGNSEQNQQGKKRGENPRVHFDKGQL
uniref:Uncharacterized protein n=1 Tax=Junco hyemalis TaxID=40217 RepID=A0A8C5NR56_JUNHY